MERALSELTPQQRLAVYEHVVEVSENDAATNKLGLVLWELSFAIAFCVGRSLLIEQLKCSHLLVCSYFISFFLTLSFFFLHTSYRRDFRIPLT